MTGAPRYAFVHNDGGRATSKRPRQTNDCGVLALAITTETPYDAVYDDLKAEGCRSCNTGTFFSRFVGQLAWDDRDYKGRLFDWRSFPAVKGQPRMRCALFCKLHPQGRYILKMARHLVACVDGVIMGDFAPDETRCIYGAWEVITPIVVTVAGRVLS